MLSAEEQQYLLLPEHFYPKSTHEGYGGMLLKATTIIMRNAGLDEAQAGIKIPRRDINNLRYADDTALMEESKEKLKRLLMR